VIKITVWNEYFHEKCEEDITRIYPDGIHNAIAAFLNEEEDFVVRTSTLEDEDYGLSDSVLEDTDVLIWWSHLKHDDIPDEIAAKVRDRVLKGMGFIPLHSSHYCKPFKMLTGSSCSLCWRDDDRERVWCIDPTHPIAAGVPVFFDLEKEEMYGEPFDIPKPDELIFIGWFKGGEVFRSGCTFERGFGKIFYFQPGHEAFPTYYNPYVKRILVNAVRWAAPRIWRNDLSAPRVEAPENNFLNK